jgi:phosphoglucomutase
MEHNMILSASGWRKVFAMSGNGEDKSSEIGSQNTALCALIAETFAQYIVDKTGKKHPTIAVATDTRPTGKSIAEVMLRVFVHTEINVRYLGISSAPEIMAYSKSLDGFLYISASHNPVGHNGIKFGLNDGGVIPGSEAKVLAENFVAKCNASNAEEHAIEIQTVEDENKIKSIHRDSASYKIDAVDAYRKFIRIVITGTSIAKEQDLIFSTMKNALTKNSLSLVCDMNGSSRILSIDRTFFPSCGISFLPFNDSPDEIKHAIIPEPENLVWCASYMNDLQKKGKKDALLGYMPDCDGDRGNIVYWNEKELKAEPIAAQEVFALCVMAEGAFDLWRDSVMPAKKGLLGKVSSIPKKRGVAVNCPTSMRIEEIAQAFGEEVFRAEVGEANVVNCAREKREAGYEVRILGEGSNGGNITYPSSVRDPVATIFAIIKLLTILDTIGSDGKLRKGLFHLWCEKSGQESKYNSFTAKGRAFTLHDIISTLPIYVTTGVSEERAVLHIKSEDKGHLKTRFQKIFIADWEKNKEQLFEKYGIVSYDAATTNGTSELIGATDWNNGNGGLKIRFFDSDKRQCAFIWMRPSGTEPVFRVLCDVKGNRPAEERSLLAWETSLIAKADA